jgi:glycosyltransferase involved in cell wall biosynthesis
MNTVTVYIPCYNAAHFLPRVIPAVMNQSHPIEEVFVIDDGSVDRTLDVAKQYAAAATYPLRIIPLTFNKGLAHARNTAVKAAKTDFVASLDSDCVPQENWLEKLMANFTNESVAGVGGKLIEGVAFNAADRWRMVHMRQHWGDNRLINPLFLYGHGTVFRTSKIKEVGYYDERHTTNGEDVQISKALLNRGYTLIYEPTAIAMHLKTDSTKTVLDTKFRYGLNKFKKARFRFPLRIAWHLVNAGHRTVKDFYNRRWSIIPVSILYPFWMIYREIIQECRKRGN